MQTDRVSYPRPLKAHRIVVALNEFSTDAAIAASLRDAEYEGWPPAHPIGATLPDPEAPARVSVRRFHA